MIEALTLENFKGFKSENPVPFLPATLIYGENSSGKSSIIQALLLMKQTLENFRPADASPLEFRGSLVDLGGFGAAVHGHDLLSKMKIGVRFHENRRNLTRLSAIRRRSFVAGEPFNVVFGFDQDPASRRVRVHSVDIDSPNLTLSFKYEKKQTSEGLFLADADSSESLVNHWVSKSEETQLRYSREKIEYSQADLSWVQGWLRRTPAEPTGLVPFWSPLELRQGRPGRPVGGSLDDPRRRVLQEIVYEWQLTSSSLQQILTMQFERLHYIGPLRQQPQRISVETSEASRELGSRGERALRVLSADPELLASLNRALSDLEIPYSLEIQELNAGKDSYDLGEISVLSLRDVRNDLIVALSDVGVGISQVIPVLIQLMLHRDSLIVVEQPELHLHPRLQARLADIVLDSISKFKNRVILETHSEHLLLRLQRRIRNGAVNAEDISVLYVSQQEARSEVNRLRLGLNGDLLDPWPNGFFDERLDDLLDLGNLFADEIDD